MVCLICIVLHIILGTLTGQYYVDKVLHPHVLPIYQTVGIKPSLPVNAPYLQYGKELFASWLWQTPLTGHPDQSPINHFLDIRDWCIHDLYPFPAATLPEFECQLVEQWRYNLDWGRGWGTNLYPGFFSSCVKGS